MEEIKRKGRGGDRGGRRPETDRKFAVTVRISQEAKDVLDGVKNKSEYIDRIIKLKIEDWTLNIIPDLTNYAGNRR